MDHQCPPGGCDCPAPHGCVYPSEDPVEFGGEEYAVARAKPSCTDLDVRLGEVQQPPEEALAMGSVFFMLNGAFEGVLAQCASGCFTQAARAAAAKLSARAPGGRVRMASPMGRRVDSLASARAQGGFVQLLLHGERFHWSPVRPGFVRRLHTEDPLEMITLSVAPAVFLVRSSNGSVIGWDNDELIREAQPLLRDSPERHYAANVEKHRTSQTAFLPFSGRQARMTQLAGSLARLASASQVESLQVVKYRRDEHYKNHQDYFVRGEFEEYNQWVKWLRKRLRKNITGDLDAIDGADPRLHPAKKSFSRAMIEHLLKEGMFNNQDSAFLRRAVTDEEAAAKLEHVAKVAPIARLARRAFASVVKRPELVMKEEPMKQNRLATLFVYLSGEFEGGATGFSSAQPPPDPPPEVVREQYGLPECMSGIQVRPKPGDAVLFYNLRADDAVEPLSQHVACPPRSGVKYGANVWIQTGHPSRLEL